MNVEAQELSNRRLSGPWLTVARLLWFALAAVVAVIVIHTIVLQLSGPPYATPSLGEASPWLRGPQQYLRCVKNCPPISEVQATVIQLALFSLYAVTATVLFLRKSDEPAPLVVSIFLLLWGASTGSGLTAPGGMVYLNGETLSLGFWLDEVVRMMCLPFLWLFMFLFPDGRFVPRRAPWLLLLLFAGYEADSLFWWQVNARVPGIPPPGITALSAMSFSARALLPVLGIAALIYRYRHYSDQIQRQQTKWVLFGAAVAFLGPALLESLDYSMRRAYDLHLSPTYLLFPRGFPTTLLYWALCLAFPLSVLVAILRYRLWDIDVLINRTAVYGLLTLGVVGLYVLIVSVLSAVLQQQGAAISLVATGGVAVAFQPLRQRLQKRVDRIMYGQRSDPYGVLADLGSRLGETATPDVVVRTIVESIAHSLKLPYVAVALEHGMRPLVSEVGDPGELQLTVPLLHEGAVLGHLRVSPRPGERTLSSADRRLLEALAAQAAVALRAVHLSVDLQRSRERLVELREEERRRLRRDLHDGLGPALASVLLKVGAARRMLDADSPAEPILREARGEIQDVVADVRRLIYNLRPPALDDLGLVAAIEQGVASYASDGLQITTDLPDVVPALPAAVEVAAYRIVQEGLTNVVRHARASCCTVRLALAQGLQVEIVDDGVGVSADRRAGVGLTSMRERVAELGGTFYIEPGPAGGTRVRAQLPLAGG